MTDRHCAYIVTLAKDIRSDDAEEGVLAALRMIKGVAAVEPVIADPSAEQAVRVRRDRAWQVALAATSRAMMLQRP
jgi:hypothetical protein